MSVTDTNPEAIFALQSSAARMIRGTAERELSLDPFLARLLLGGVRELPPVSGAPVAVQRQIGALVQGGPGPWCQLWAAHERALRAFAAAHRIAPGFTHDGRPAFFAERVAAIERARAARVRR
jgi:hypothetical protein